MAVATKVRTLGSKGVWGLCPQPGVPPLHPVLTNPSMAIKRVVDVGPEIIFFKKQKLGSIPKIGLWQILVIVRVPLICTA